MKRKAPKMPVVPNADGIERHDAYTRINPKGHQEFVADDDEETLNELTNEISRLLESISFSGPGQVGAGAGSAEQQSFDRRHNKLVPSDREVGDTDMTASEPLEADGPEMARAKSKIGTGNIRNEGSSHKDMIRPTHSESFTGTGAIAIGPGPLQPTSSQSRRRKKRQQLGVSKTESLMKNQNGIVSSIQSLLNEWEPKFVAGEYSPGEGGVESPKGEGVQSSSLKKSKGGTETTMKNHGDLFGASHKETAAMCDVEENGVETKPQGGHESSVGEPDDGHQQKMGHDWPSQPKNKGGSFEHMPGNRYSDGGTLGSVKEGWDPRSIGSMMGEDINLQDLFDAYAKNVNVVCVEDFQAICNANGFATRLTDQNLKALMSVNSDFMFLEGVDANGPYWQVTPIAGRPLNEFQIRSPEEEIRGIDPDFDMQPDGPEGFEDEDMGEGITDMEVDEPYDSGEGRFGGDGCPECGAFCGNEMNCPQCGCEVNMDSGEEAAFGGSDVYTKDIGPTTHDIGPWDDMMGDQRMVDRDPSDQDEGDDPALESRLHRFLTNAKSILESSASRTPSQLAKRKVGQALARSWRMHAEGVDLRSVPRGVRNVIGGLTRRFDAFADAISEGELGGGGFKPPKLDDQPSPDDMKELGEPLGKSQENDLDGTPIIAGTGQLSGKSKGKISKAVKENIIRLSRHVRKHLLESVRSLRGRCFPEFQVQVVEGKAVNLTPVRKALSEALADAEEVLQHHDSDNVKLMASFRDSKGEVVLVNDVPLLTINRRGLLATEGAVLFRFKRIAERYADRVVAEGRTCRVVSHNWGTAVMESNKKKRRGVLHLENEGGAENIYLMDERRTEDGGMQYIFHIMDGVSLTIYTDQRRNYAGWDCPNIDDMDQVQSYLDVAGEMLEQEGKMLESSPPERHGRMMESKKVNRRGVLHLENEGDSHGGRPSGPHRQ